MSEPVYLLTGEAFLAETALDRLRGELNTDPLSEAAFDATAPAHEIVGALGTSSLLGGTRLVIVRGAGDLNKDQNNALVDYLNSPSPDSILVLVGTAKAPLAKKVKETGAVISQDPPKGRALIGWLKAQAGQHQIKLDDRGAWALLDAVGNELRDLDAALEQLSTGIGRGSKAGAAEIRRAFPRLADERVYAFTDAVGERKLAGAMGTLRRLLEQGDEPLMLFGALTSHVRKMLQARRFAEQGPRAVGDALGMPEWRARKMQTQMLGYREEELVAALKILAETDLEMKGGDVPPEVALERAVIQIVSGQTLLPA